MVEPIQWTERLSTRANWLIVASILAVGCILEFVLVPTWFQRSGSLVVAFAAYLFITDRRSLDAWAKWLSEDHEKRVAELRAPVREANELSRFHKTLGDNQAAQVAKNEGSEAFRESLPEVRSSLAQYHAELNDFRRFKRSEARMFVLGTVVWGFGDWAMNLIRCGEWTCSY